MTPYNLEEQLMEISKGVNSIRPLLERGQYFLGLKKPVVTPNQIVNFIRKNESTLHKRLPFPSAGYFVQIVGSNYVIRTYPKDEFLSLMRETSDIILEGKSLPETDKQWAIPVEEMDRYLKQER